LSQSRYSIFFRNVGANPNQKVNTIASLHVDQVRRRKDHRCVDFISDLLPSVDPGNRKLDDAIRYAKFHSQSHDTVIRVYDEVGNVIETHEHAGDFKEW
jgi:hypothetical protein